MESEGKKKRKNDMTTEPNSVSKSGITVDAVTGERYVPSSVRADGSRRREIRVRPGYKPPEDVELYKNRAAAAWKSRNQAAAAAAGGVPGAEGLKSDNEGSSAASATAGVATTTASTTATSAASNKNAKRREAKKKAKAAGDQPSGGKNVAEIANWRASAAGNNEPGKTDQTDQTAETAETQPDADAENEKKARNLKKKLRQARDLNDKKIQGEALLPEQLEKVIKINELVRQLDSLGFDSNGDKREANASANDEPDKKA